MNRPRTTILQSLKISRRHRAPFQLYHVTIAWRLVQLLFHADLRPEELTLLFRTHNHNAAPVTSLYRPICGISNEAFHPAEKIRPWTSAASSSER